MAAVALSTGRAPRRHDPLAAPFGLALLMHALLFGAMTLAVQWRTQPQAPIVAELWSGLPALPAPEAAVPPPPPAPAPVPVAPERPADITLEQKKLREGRTEPPRKAEPRKEDKKAEPRAEARKAEPRREEAKAPPLLPPPPGDLDRIMAQARAGEQPGVASAAGVTGAAAGGSTVRGADASYAAQVIACIRPHIVFTVAEGASPAVYADFRVELLPDGSVAGVRLLRASGLPGYDAAAERAIRRCDPFPRKRDGSIDRTIDVRMYPVEAR
jgi:colicin import membrane protein